MTRVWTLVLSLVAMMLAARAEDVSVRATLSHRSAEVGEPVQLQISVSGPSKRANPPEVNVDGLDVRYFGPSSSQQIQMINGQITRQVTTTHVYQVTAKRAGEFTIPALTVDVDGKACMTQPVVLKAEKASGGGSGDDDRIAFAEIDVSKHIAYVGEVVPAELNLYIDARVPSELEQMPELKGEGFTKQKMPQPRQQNARKDGRDWRVVAFRTAITPGKAGRITIGPNEISLIAQVPQKRPRRGPRDPFGSLFDDPFFGGVMAERRRYEIVAPEVVMDVKPLPAEGRPADFSGAVGQFKFTAEGSPARAKIGDPVTMKMKVTGTGNFDRMQSPAMIDPKGWHAYPASDSFEATDDLKITGTKTFEMPVVPEVAHREMPQFRFAFFDPEQGKYVTLTSAPAPLVVDGAPPPAPAPVPPAANEPKPEAPRPAAATPAPTDILGLRYERGRAVSSFAPLYAQRGFLLAQLVPLALAGALLGARFLRRDSRAVRVAGLRRERDRLWQKLRGDTGASEFYDLAARLVQVDTALAADLEPASIDAAAARRSRALDDETSAGLDEIFNARAELLYAGSGPDRGAITADDRRRVLGTLERFAKSHA